MSPGGRDTHRLTFGLPLFPLVLGNGTFIDHTPSCFLSPGSDWASLQRGTVGSQDMGEGSGALISQLPSCHTAGPLQLTPQMALSWLLSPSLPYLGIIPCLSFSI